MKTRRVWVLALIFIAPLSLQAQAPGLINMAEADPFTVLHIYREASGLELITSSQVNKVTARITIQPTGSVEESEMLKLIEKALLEQAAIVMATLPTAQIDASNATTQIQGGTQIKTRCCGALPRSKNFGKAPGDVPFLPSAFRPESAWGLVGT